MDGLTHPLHHEKTQYPFGTKTAESNGMKTKLGIFAGIIFGALFTQVVACEESVNDLENRVDCFQYCDRANECDSSVDEDVCRAECREDLDNCAESEVQEAQDLLDECSESTCIEFSTCPIEVGAQCSFGL